MNQTEGTKTNESSKKIDELIEIFNSKNINKLFLKTGTKYFYYDGMKWDEIKKIAMYNTIANEIKKHKEIPDTYGLIRKNFSEIKKYYTTMKQLKINKTGQSHIGFNNGILYLADEELLRNIPTLIFPHSCEFEYKNNSTEAIDYVNYETEIYKYLMISMYEVLTTGSQKYILQYNNDLKDSVIPSLERIFGKYIHFIDIDEKPRHQEGAVIFYSKGVKDWIKYKDKLIIPLNNYEPIKETEDNKVFLQSICKYGATYKSKQYNKPESVKEVKQPEIKKPEIKKKDAIPSSNGLTIAIEEKRPELIIMRGLPGSGKDTYAKTNYPNHELISADQYFETKDGYNFDLRRANDAHNWCFNKVCSNIKDKKNVVVCNTFIKRNDVNRYIASNSDKAKISVIRMKSQYKSIHNVPQDVIERMKRTMEDYPEEIIKGNNESSICN
ncbi:MAG: ATP-binding protein [Hyperionvirus sp.]|uniref:ATP-binding protein n=1 Tax=Hyperionvirus sp. TaxID=2487770 RepID=A0A3G5ABH3_9VIRU|nr:MAG: ATP-binding protein [Hyperionvirus sp.]